MLSKWELNLMNGQVQPRVDVKPNKKYESLSYLDVR